MPAPEPAWIGSVDAAGDAELRFSRAGPEFTLEAGSGGQRIGYRLRNGAVEVLYWPYLDQPASVPPQAYALVATSRGFASPISTRAERGANAGRCWASPRFPARSGSR